MKQKEHMMAVPAFNLSLQQTLHVTACMIVLFHISAASAQFLQPPFLANYFREEKYTQPEIREDTEDDEPQK